MKLKKIIIIVLMAFTLTVFYSCVVEKIVEKEKSVNCTEEKLKLDNEREDYKDNRRKYGDRSIELERDNKILERAEKRYNTLCK